MFTHIVCWRYKASTTEAERSEHIAALRALGAVIEDIVSLSVGADVLHLERSFDTGLVAVFRDKSGLDRYTDHPEHMRVASFGKSIADTVVSVDMVSEDGS
ncbi:MAG: Dabb family protein [Acidobacteria bacterium]|nr:Dabb family protein [Acidobacteriota bacterium]MCW5950197.1 Dabb family protein [Pyrinomonadaceae bacterium]